MRILLPDEAATLALGRRIARALPGVGPYPALLLVGPLGAGKTTFVRGLVSALPGAEEAEVASPSFNLVNLYPTRPAVAHFDLYRAERGLDDDLAEILHGREALCAVEWAERLGPADAPKDALTLVFTPLASGREAVLSGLGSGGQTLYNRLSPAPEEHPDPEDANPSRPKKESSPS